jgi:Zn-finger nucleic acid-binding protein/RNA polymerase subunit RPABC4/transcription elongation factor Spt4
MPDDASSLHCPNCGAPVDPDARRCPYCKARLATISCPSCFALMFDGTAFCPKCGTRRARSEQDDVQARCSGCSKAMQRLQIGTTILLECTSCDGLWVDADTFEALCADKEAQAAVLHQYNARTPVKGDRVKYRPCARCGKMMNRVNFGRLSGIVVDVCKGHGTYLDPGELHAIVAFIQSGGLDRARARQLEELKEQERRMREAEHKLARERGKADPQRSTAGWTVWTFMVGDE